MKETYIWFKSKIQLIKGFIWPKFETAKRSLFLRMLILWERALDLAATICVGNSRCRLHSNATIASMIGSAAGVYTVALWGYCSKCSCQWEDAVYRTTKLLIVGMYMPTCDTYPDDILSRQDAFIFLLMMATFQHVMTKFYFSRQDDIISSKRFFLVLMS